MTTAVRLRAHHLLCLLTFVGDGYSAAFVAQLDAVARRVAAGAPIELVDGPDEICAPLIAENGERAHCFRRSVRRRDRLAHAAVFGPDGPLAGHVPAALDGAARAALRAAFAAGTIRAACRGCSWFDLCSSIASRGYDGVIPADQEPYDPSGYRRGMDDTAG